MQALSEMLLPGNVWGWAMPRMLMEVRLKTGYRLVANPLLWLSSPTLK